MPPAKFGEQEHPEFIFAGKRRFSALDQNGTFTQLGYPGSTNTQVEGASISGRASKAVSIGALWSMANLGVGIGVLLHGGAALLSALLSPGN